MSTRSTLFYAEDSNNDNTIHIYSEGINRPGTSPLQIEVSTKSGEIIIDDLSGEACKKLMKFYRLWVGNKNK